MDQYRDLPPYRAVSSMFKTVSWSVADHRAVQMPSHWGSRSAPHKEMSSAI